MNNLQLLAIPELMNKHFFIPDYQRGYRWETSQVSKLISDLEDYFKGSSGSFYCLQPIVVKECSPETIEKYNLPDLSAMPEHEEGETDDAPKSNVWYEVIDGQQRLTTIRILIEYYKQMYPFISSECVPLVLSYATRPTLEDAFKSLIMNPHTQSVDFKKEYGFRNVDTEYIRNAAATIFGYYAAPKTLNDLSKFLSTFYNKKNDSHSVQVVWYETREDTDARDIFERLNDLKIPLSSAELIRALFLSKNAVYDFEPTASQKKALTEEELKKLKEWDKEKKQSSINAKWDEIEHFFGNKEVWHFITNEEQTKYRNCIELLFDFIAEKKPSIEDKLYTFTCFDNQAQRLGLWELWNKVLSYYDTIKYWYEDRDFYHQIGFVVSIYGFEEVVRLLKDAHSDSCKKSQFRTNLKNKIKGSVATSKKMSELSYKEDYKVLWNMLFLYNVELSRTSSDKQRFPFGEFKMVGNTAKWTLEHIHAQNSECLNPNKRKEWKAWIGYTLTARKNLINQSEKDKSFIEELEKALRAVDNEEKFRYEDVKLLFDKDVELWSGGQPSEVVHELANLALLSGDVNSGIGKGSFNVKHQYINKCLVTGTYIPIGTQRVFLKLYNETVDATESRNNDDTQELVVHQHLSWNDADRNLYLAHIRETLKMYFI